MMIAQCECSDRYRLKRTENAATAVPTAMAGATVPTLVHMAAPGNPPAINKWDREKDGRYSTSRRATDVGGSATMPTDVVTLRPTLPRALSTWLMPTHLVRCATLRRLTAHRTPVAVTAVMMGVWMPCVIGTMMSGADLCDPTVTLAMELSR